MKFSGPKSAAKMDASAHSVEDLLVKVAAITDDVATFEMFVPSELTWKEQPVRMDIAMAILMDAILGKELMPNGFDECEGGRLYKYHRETPA